VRGLHRAAGGVQGGGGEGSAGMRPVQNRLFEAFYDKRG
jgi:hypothetical protein